MAQQGKWLYFCTIKTKRKQNYSITSKQQNTMTTLSILAISNASLVWLLIAAFIVGALALRIADAVSTVRKLDKANEAKKALKLSTKKDAKSVKVA